MAPGTTGEDRVDFRLCSAIFRILKSQKELYFQEGHGVWIWEERTRLITFLFLETSNIYFTYSRRVSGLQKYIGSWWQNWEINTAQGNLIQVP